MVAGHTDEGRVLVEINAEKDGADGNNDYKLHELGRVSITINLRCSG